MSMSHQPQPTQQQWTPDQRRQQIAELLRNKGVICRDYLYTSRCPRTPSCPYMHVANGETRPVPWSVCTFFTQGKCLRDRCTFFHGSQAQLEELHATGLPVYRPQDYMKIAVPPAQYLNADGSIASNISIPAVAPPLPASLPMIRGPAMAHDNGVNTFQPVVLVQQGTQAISQTMFSGQGNTPNSSTTQYSFYSNAPMSVPQTQPGYSQGMQSVPHTAYYQSNTTQQLQRPQQTQQYTSAPHQYSMPPAHQQLQKPQQQQQQQRGMPLPPQQQQQQQQAHHQHVQQQHQPHQQVGSQLYFHIQQ